MNNDTHFKKFFQLDLSWGNNCTYNLERCSIEFCMADLEVLKENLDEAKLFKDKNKGRVPFNDDW